MFNKIFVKWVKQQKKKYKNQILLKEVFQTKVKLNHLKNSIVYYLSNRKRIQILFLLLFIVFVYHSWLFFPDDESKILGIKPLGLYKTWQSFIYISSIYLNTVLLSITAYISLPTKEYTIKITFLLPATFYGVEYFTSIIQPDYIIADNWYNIVIPYVGVFIIIFFISYVSDKISRKGIDYRNTISSLYDDYHHGINQPISSIKGLIDLKDKNLINNEVFNDLVYNQIKLLDEKVKHVYKQYENTLNINNK